MKKHRQTGALIILALSLLFIYFLKTIDFKASDGEGRAAPMGPATVDDEAAPVDLNSASKEELMRLPGIGATLAERIIEMRGAAGAGGFKSVDELKDVRGIGDAKFKNLRGLVSLSGSRDDGEVKD
jgi:competence ComEA-like helix-hairpin-helix protein